MKSISLKLVGAAMLMAATLTVSAQSSEDRKVSGFNGIGVSSLFNVHVKIDGKESLKITGPAELMKDIETPVEGGKLEIRFRKDFYRENFNEKIDVYVSAKSLSSLTCSGAAKIDVEEGALTGDNVHIGTSGASKITSEVKTGSFDASLSGASNLTLKGSATSIKFQVSGAAKIFATDLKSEDAELNMSGAAIAHIYADKTISAHLSGAGHVMYRGNATIRDVRSAGANRITKENGE